MEPVLHVSEAEAVDDMASLLRRVEAGMEVVIERDSRPVAVIRPATTVHRTTSESIALAKAHEEERGDSPVLDSDFAADLEQIIRGRKPRTPLAWD